MKQTNYGVGTEYGQLARETFAFLPQPAFLGFLVTAPCPGETPPLCADHSANLAGLSRLPVAFPASPPLGRFLGHRLDNELEGKGPECSLLTHP